MIRFSGVGAVGFCFAATATGQVFDEDMTFRGSDWPSYTFFGGSVAASGSFALASAVRFNEARNAHAQAYLFDIETGAELFKLESADPIGTNGGSASGLDVKNGLALLGAFLEQDRAGVTCLFDTATGALLHTLVADDAARGDSFGQSVALGDGIAVIGAPFDDYSIFSNAGSVYVFDTTTGEQISKLTPSGIVTGDAFGVSVDVSGDIAVVGASDENNASFDNGSVYVIDLPTGSVLHKLEADDAVQDHNFGRRVAISGRYVVVGTVEDGELGEQAGAAYVFDVDTGEQLYKLLPSDGGPNRRFGNSVAVDGSIAVIGSEYDDVNGERAGSAYVFDLQTGTPMFKLLPSDGDQFSYFGSSVAVVNGRAVVGARSASQRGIVYGFDVDQQPCSADANADGVLAPADFTAWVLLFNSRQWGCDQNGDSICDPADFTAWVMNFNAGCP